MSFKSFCAPCAAYFSQLLALSTLLLTLFVPIAYSQNITTRNVFEQVFWHFDDHQLGRLPDQWKTGVEEKETETAIWQVVREAGNARQNHVLAMATPSNGGFMGLFGRAHNQIWNDEFLFQDGEIKVNFRSISGLQDQGGGIMWRVQDKDNYYLARFNPLEENFRIYFVRNGSRQELTGISVRLSDHDWHTMKIVQRGNEFEGYLDGELLLRGSSNLFRDAGGVGLWTKADAVTWFDDLSIGFGK